MRYNMSTEDTNIISQNIGASSVVLGNAQAPAKHAIAIGASPRTSRAVNEAAISIGQNQLAGRLSGNSILWAIAIGADSVSDGQASIALGQNVIASAHQGVAIGQNSSVTEKGSVALGADSIANKPDIISVGKPGNERKVINVAAGNITNISTEAINGQQLYAASERINLLESKNTQLEGKVAILEKELAFLKKRLFDALNY